MLVALGLSYIVASGVEPLEIGLKDRFYAV
jgi:hypothetical protein